MRYLIKYLYKNYIGLLVSAVLGASVSSATGWNVFLMVLIFVASYIFINFDVSLILKYIEVKRKKKLIAPDSNDKTETMSKIKFNFITDLKKK